MLSDVPEKIIGDVRDKIAHLYQKEPEIANNDTLLQFAFWSEFDGLQHVLGDKYDEFKQWFFSEATKTSSIERSRRSMTEAGTLPQREQVKEGRAIKQEEERKYWGPYR